MSIADFGNFLGPDTLVIFLIILVLFGAKRLPELGRGLGQALREFRDAKDEFDDDPGTSWDWIDWSLVATFLLILVCCVLAVILF